MVKTKNKRNKKHKITKKTNGKKYRGGREPVSMYQSANTMYQGAQFASNPTAYATKQAQQLASKNGVDLNTLSKDPSGYAMGQSKKLAEQNGLDLSQDPRQLAANQAQKLAANAGFDTNKLSNMTSSLDPLKQQEALNNQTFVGQLAHSAEKTIGDTVGSVLDGTKEILNSAGNTEKIHDLSEKASAVLGAAEPFINESEKIAEEAVIKTVQTGTEAAIAASNMFPPIEAANAIADLVKEGAIVGKSMLAEGKAMLQAKDQLTSPINNLISDFKQGKDQLQGQINNVQTRVPATGGSLKNIIKHSKMIGGRIQKSRSEFLNPQLVLSQLINPHKRKTHKRKIQKTL